MWQVKNIEQEICDRMFRMSNQELQQNNAVKRIIKEPFSAPCRLTLTDMNPGDEAILFNYFHHNVDSPYRAMGPVFVKCNSKKCKLSTNTLPEIVLPQRRFSIRSFDVNSMTIDAEIVLGENFRSYVDEKFQNKDVNYLQIHFAAYGCWAFDIFRVLNC